MTTPRIEETRKRILEEMNARRVDGKTYIDSEWLLAEYEKNLFTEAHQAGKKEGIDEAVAREKQLRDIHKIELDTISCMSLEQFVVWSDQRKQPKDDTIKALQDK